MMVNASGIMSEVAKFSGRARPGFSLAVIVQVQVVRVVEDACQAEAGPATVTVTVTPVPAYKSLGSLLSTGSAALEKLSIAQSVSV